jgi:hypothetical protein
VELDEFTVNARVTTLSQPTSLVVV